MGYYDDEYRPGGFAIIPPAIKTIILVNVGVFLLQFMTPFGGFLTGLGALWPIDSGNFEVWQPLTYMFLHGGFTHILFNMFALWIFGAEIENYWGTRHFTTYYFVCGVGAALINLIASIGAGGPTVGASGAVFGVLLAFGMMFPNRYIFLYFLFPIKAKYFVAGYAIIEFFSTFNINSPVAHFAHLGGMLVGYVYIKIMQGEWPLQDWLDKIFPMKDSSPNQPSSREREEKIDVILDKISRSGYESLSSEEKRILLEASKDNKKK
ncbi:Rhomboid family protein [Chloroherpeton thalassium ATCC 35110]|uniref:Rhomboid family protein n=1 Tax=Chloroherpeton thalassium (strain ATCC 35110 / GB-78) TaxID=517418 RepID=B3QWD8_CHLT3|nr:rhomboid family intramembrane serine protease [Chloroherpeton thalassium]ACF13251.1 Rhomboid family protein [Chloroherpeton thalassium ATCC 35110]